MRIAVAVLMCSVLWLCPILVEAGTTGEQPPEQHQLLSKDNIKLIQERLRAEGVYAGPLDGGGFCRTPRKGIFRGIGD